jgi:cytochrome d ubiquinol oxidase subunit II
VSIALHVPLTLALIGIVLRGTSFVFYSYDLRKSPRTRGWARSFGVSSLVTPFLLGDCLAALSTSAIRWDGRVVTTGYFAGWTTPFAFGTGLFTSLLFALLAAVYLTADSEPQVKDDFRNRALVLEVATGLVAFIVFLLARREAPVLFAGLSASAWSSAVQVGTALAAFSTLAALATRRYRLARATVALQIGLVVVGWGLSMRGAIVLPDVRIDNAGARGEVLRVLLPTLALGTAVLLPSLAYLLRIFKAKT